MTIIETFECSRCHDESVDVVLEDNEIKVIGGCINCDHMPVLDETDEMAIHMEHCCGCAGCEGGRYE
jgi:hypothetical protein